MAIPRLNEAAISHLLTGRGGMVDRHFSRHAVNVRNMASALAPADTGALKSSMRINRTGLGPIIVWTIGSPLSYARYPNCGTGIYVGNGPIVPRRARKLVFQWQGRRWVLDSVRGQPPQKFMIEALRRGQPYPVTPLPCP